MTSIGSYIFNGCVELSEVYIPRSLYDISVGAFSGCVKLKSVHIANGPNSINRNAFDGCTRLESISIPSSVTLVDENAFINCTSLTELELIDGTEELELFASSFQGCPLETIYLGRDLLYEPSHPPFLGIMETLEGLTIGHEVTIIPSNLFLFCTKLTEIYIPSNVKSIENNAFSLCRGVTTVFFENGIKTIGESAFNDCEALTSIDIPNSVTEIGKSAFRNCLVMSTAIIGNHVMSIGEFAFHNCTSLTSIYSWNPTPPEITATTFDEETEQNAKLYVPVGSKTLYWLHPYWEDFVSINEGGPITPGDVNGDGQVGIADVSSLIDLLLSGSTSANTGGDVNGDGQVTIADVSALIDLLLGAH